MPEVKDGKKPSNRLLGMKFMQRSMEKEMQEKIEKERKRVISEAEWVLDRKEIQVEKPKIQIEYQPSFLPFTDHTTAGRRSFHNFNKQVESNAEKEEQDQRLAREEEKEKANQVSDEELSNYMQTVRSVSKKSKKRKDPQDKDASNIKKPKLAPNTFIKPE